MWRDDETVFHGNRKTVKWPDSLPCLLEILIEEIGASKSFWEEDLCQAIGLFLVSTLSYELRFVRG